MPEREQHNRKPLFKSTHMKRLFLFSSLAALLPLFQAEAQTQTSASTPAEAQISTPTTDSVALYGRLDDIEVTAVRLNDAASMRQTTLRAADLSETRFAQDVPGALSMLPSVVSFSENGSGLGGGSLSIRGTDATRISVTLNGMSMNNPDSHAMYWYDTPDLLSGVGSVQLIRGAGTSTNGTGAFGGALCFSSAPLQERFSGDVSLSYGSFATSKQSVHIGTGRMGRHLMADLRLSHLHSDGYVDRGFTEMVSGMFQLGWFADASSLKWVAFGGKTKTYLTYNGLTQEEMDLYGPTYHTSGQYVCDAGPAQLSDGTHVAYFDDQTDNYFQLNNQLVWNHSFSSDWRMNAVAYHSWGDGYYRQYKDDAWLCGYDNLCSDDTQADLIRRKTMKSHTFGLNAAGVHRSDRIDLTFGGGFQQYLCRHYGLIDWIDACPAERYEGFVWYDNDVAKSDANLFAKALWTPAAGWRLSADLQWRIVKYRADGVNDNYDWNAGVMQPVAVDKVWNFFNPGASLSYDFSKAHHLTLSFAVAHKEPTRSDFTDRYLFSSLTDDPKPETLYDWELSWRFERRVFSLGLNLYYMYYRDQLVPTGIINDSSDNLNVNVDRSFRRGIEALLSLNPWRWLSFEASATLSQNRIEDYVEIIDGQEFPLGETDIANSPSVLAKGKLSFHAKGFEAVLQTQYVGRYYVTNGCHDDLSLPARCVSDLMLSYALPCGGLPTPENDGKKAEVCFSLKLANLFDARYCASAYGGSYLDGGERKSWMYVFPQPPCNVHANVTVSF